MDYTLVKYRMIITYMFLICIYIYYILHNTYIYILYTCNPGVDRI